jgi:hypothetical protein
MKTLRQDRGAYTRLLVRYAQAGDPPGWRHRRQPAAYAGRHQRRQMLIAFSHKPMLGDDAVAVENRHVIARAVEAGFTVNLSADNPMHADQLAALRIGLVVSVLARTYAAAQAATGSYVSGTSGARRLTNGVTARHISRDTR